MEVPQLAQPECQIQQLLSCKLCYEKAKKPLVCPQCARFYCENCIKTYLRNKQSKCPQCLKFLQISQLINGDKISHQLGTVFVRLDSNPRSKRNNNNCTQHDLPKAYYCIPCKTALCSDCSVLTPEHRTHQLVKLSQIKNDFLHKNNALLQSLDQKKKFLEQQKNLLLESQQKSLHGKQNKVMLLQHRIRALSQKVSHKLTGFIEACEKAKIIEQENLQKYKKAVQQLSQQAQTYPKAKFVSKAYKRLQAQLSKIQVQYKSSCLSGNFWKRTEDEIKSELVPQPSRRKFKLASYSSLREKRGFVYSDVLFSEGLEWRLKIYPCGIHLESEKEDSHEVGQTKLEKRKNTQNVGKNEECLSIYVELKSGCQSKGEYIHQVQIANHKDEKKRLSRRFVSKFESGECWGYDCFAKVNKLYNEGFVHPNEDYLQIYLQVGAATYYHAVQNQQQMIEIKAQKYRKISQKFIECHARMSRGRITRATSLKENLCRKKQDYVIQTLEEHKQMTPRVNNTSDKETEKRQQEEAKHMDFELYKQRSQEIFKGSCDRPSGNLEIQLKKIYIKTQDVAKRRV